MSGTIKLDFRQTPVFGRTQEIRTLQDAFHEACAEQRNGPVVCFVQGATGTGKSRLVDEFQTITGKKCFCCRGNFDRMGLAVIPLSAVVACLQDLTKQLIAHNRRLWKRRLEGEVHSECWGLSQYVTRLRDLIGEKEVRCREGRRKSAMSSIERIKMGCLKFLETVSVYHPVVFVIENMHCADRVSMSLLQSFLVGFEARNFLFIGTYETTRANNLMTRLENDIQEQSDDDDNDVKFEKIGLHDLTKEAVDEFVRNVVRRDDDEVQRLSDVVYQKTRGNPFYIIQFLRQLEKDQLFFYSTRAFRFEWKLDSIVDQTDSSDNVAKHIVGKLKTLPDIVQRALIGAACLAPTSFTVDTLVQAIQAIDHDTAPPSEASEAFRKSISSDEVETVLQRAAEEGLVDRLGPDRNSYKFTHEFIQESAYALVPQASRKRLHQSIGNELRNRLDQLEKEEKGTKLEESLVLQAVHQFDRSCNLDDCHDRELVEVADLHLRAGEVALDRFSFYAAASYLRPVVERLEHGWKDHYDLMLKLSTRLIQADMGCGRFKECKETSDSILKHARCFKDKLSAYQALITCLVHEGRYDVASRVTISVLNKLGVHIPAHFQKMRAAAAVRKSKIILQRKTEQELLSLPKPLEIETRPSSLAEDEMPVPDVSYFLATLLNLGNASGRPELAAFGMRHMLEQAKADGASKTTGLAFAIYGQLMQSQGNSDDAFRFGTLSQKFSQEDDSHFEALSLVTHHLLIHHWKKPYSESLDPLLKCYKLFMKTSDVEFASIIRAFHAYSQFYFFSGLQLIPIEADMRKFSDAMTDFNETIPAACYQVWYQLVRSFRGRHDEPQLLFGDEEKEDAFVTKWMATKNKVMLKTMWFCRMILAYYFADYEVAAIMSDNLDRSADLGTDVTLAQRCFYQGMVAVEMAKRSGKKDRCKHQKKVKSVLKKLEQWVREGTVNCHHMMLLLKAENDALEAKGMVQGTFDTAINAAAKLGFTHHQALANERAAIHFLDRDDKCWARTYITRARELYDAWDAQSKVQQLQDKYKEFFPTPVSKKHGGALRARPRLDEVNRENFKSMRHSVKILLGQQSGIPRGMELLRPVSSSKISPRKTPSLATMVSIRGRVKKLKQIRALRKQRSEKKLVPQKRTSVVERGEF